MAWKSTWTVPPPLTFSRGFRAASTPSSAFCVSIFTVVLVKRVKSVPEARFALQTFCKRVVSICTVVLVKRVKSVPEARFALQTFCKRVVSLQALQISASVFVLLY
jgi:hypothetical protein